jgi:quercetin dioxygenase-like cupin family protein
MQVHNWQGIEKEQLNPLYTRQVIHSDTMTVVRVHFKKGCEVAEHSHPNEQVSMVEQGALKFVMDGVEQVVRPGGVVRIAPNLLHSVQAIEDCVMVEVFSPRRQDWIDAADANVRK